jgi:hypothetical protein
MAVDRIRENTVSIVEKDDNDQDKCNLWCTCQCLLQSGWLVLYNVDRQTYKEAQLHTRPYYPPGHGGISCGGNGTGAFRYKKFEGVEPASWRLRLTCKLPD